MSSQGLAPQDVSRPTVLARDLAPWQPDIDARRGDKPQIITGKNFRDGIDGPFSGWSSEFVNFNSFDTSTRAKISEIRLDTVSDILYGTPTGIYQIDPSSLVAVCVLPVTVTNVYWPWTSAYVGGVYYIAQYDIGLYQYDPTARTFTKLSTPNGDTVRYIIEDNGRLITFTDTVIGVSSLDDGTDFIPSLATGAGAQALSIGGGTPYFMKSVTDGFLVYTSAGIIKASFTGQAYVYSFRGNFSDEIKLFSPNAACHIPTLNGIISLDRNGFFLTKGYNYQTYGIPQPWEVPMGDFIKKNIINPMDKTKIGCMGIYYSQVLQCIFFYFGSNIQQGLFTSTFVFDCVSSRWGSFDAQHYGIFETYDAVSNSYSCSYMDVNGYMRQFTLTNFSEDYPASPTGLNDFAYRPTLTDEKVIRYTDPAVNGGVFVDNVFTEIMISDFPPYALQNFTASGLYEMNSAILSDTVNNSDEDPAPDFSSSPGIVGTYINVDYSGAIENTALVFISPEVGLDSFITIGPFRYNGQNVGPHETSLLEAILLGMNGSNDFTISEDWNLLSGSEDWNSLSGAEDWGAGSQFPNIYSLTLRDTNDGFSELYTGDEVLEIENDLGSSQLFKPSGNSSIYHNLTIAAENVGEAYNLKTIDLTAQPTGVLVNA